MESQPRIRVLGDGSPPVVVLIHGMASSGRIWLKMLKAMGPKGTFIMPDLPGMGESGSCPDATFPGWLKLLRQVALSGPDAARLAGAAPLARVRLVGHSLGGSIAMSLAREGWVESVALVAPATRPFCGEMRRVCRPGRRPGSILLRRAPGSLAHDPSSLTRQDAAVLREDYARAIPLLESGSPWPYFPEKECLLLRGKRTLVVWGEEDKVVPPRYARELADDLAAAGVAVEAASIPDCGHVPMLEHPAELARILEGFWNR